MGFDFSVTAVSKQSTLFAIRGDFYELHPDCAGIAWCICCLYGAWRSLFAAIPSLKGEFLKYPAVYRSREGQMSHMPTGMAAMLLAMVVLSVLYAMIYKDGSGVAQGAVFGALIGVYAIGSFVLHNYVNLNIGIRTTAFSAIAYFVEWTVVGVVIGMIYRPVQ